MVLVHDVAQGMDKVVYHEDLSSFRDELQRTSVGSYVPNSVVKDSYLMYDSDDFVERSRYVGILGKKEIGIDITMVPLLYVEVVGTLLVKVD